MALLVASGLVRSRLVEAVTAWQGKVSCGSARYVPLGPGKAVEARRGLACPGAAWLGESRPGEARFVAAVQAWQGGLRPVKAGRVPVRSVAAVQARPGLLRPVLSRQGAASLGEAVEAVKAWLVMVLQG
ncbi:MAG: hypothetical protein V3S55_09745 [Nitrospiraceae bacterium]